ncbi:MAG: redoxin domain-containing protein [Bacteroidales bacterium]|nr:redoxin domain-containing protein [Bacteroidales bacterium]
MKRIAVLLAALFFVAGAALSAQAPQPTEDLDATYATDLLKKGTKAPAFTLRDVDGKTYTLKDFRGKTLVIDF